jgi:hypothetical protein
MLVRLKLDERSITCNFLVCSSPSKSEYKVGIENYRCLLYSIGRRRYHWEKGLSRIHIVVVDVVADVQKPKNNYLHSVERKNESLVCVSLYVCVCVYLYVCERVCVCVSVCV